MDKDTKNPLNNKIIDSKSYIKITVDSDYNYGYEFIYVDDEDAAYSDSDDCLYVE